MDDFDLIAILRDVGALKEGHFLLSSGRHSDQYVEKFDLLRQPAAASLACSQIVERVRDLTFDIVVGPVTGGILLAFEVGRQTGFPAAYAERAAGGAPGLEIRRGTVFEPGSRVLVVDDILTTGGSVRDTLAALEPHNVQVVGVAVLVDRSGGTVTFDVPTISLGSMDISTWDPEACPLCADGVPLTKPGTSVTSAGR